MEGQLAPDLIELWRSKACGAQMSDEESENEFEEEDVWVVRSPPWRDVNLTNIIRNLPVKKGNAKTKSILGEPSNRPPPNEK